MGNPMSAADESLRELAIKAIAKSTGQEAPGDAALAKLRDLGTELWLDTGSLDEAAPLWRREFAALTTNNTLANQVVQRGEMDEVARAAASEIRKTKPGLAPRQFVMELGFVVNCHIALRLIGAFDARVSVELHPSVAEDIDQTVKYAERYHAVCPERFIIKIPMTPEGYCATARVRAKGIPVNYTLGFSARQNVLAALISNPSYCNVFLGRLNQVVIENKKGDGANVGERAALATQRELLELRNQSRTKTRLIAASMRSSSQMVDLAGIDVFTVPPKAAGQFLASAPPPDSIVNRVADVPEVVFAEDAADLHPEVLWDVSDRDWALFEDLAQRNVLELTGDDLREADADHGARLFHRYTPTEVLELRQHGKIPDWARWRTEHVALDDLMTQSALQSFAVDQGALDDRLRKLAQIA